MTTYSSYMQADTYPPIFVSAFVCIIAFAMVAVVIYRIHINGDREQEILCFTGMYAAVSIVFGDGIRKDSSNANTRYFLWNRKICASCIPFLFLIIPALICCFFAAFWDVFLIEESLTCNPDLDCFPFSEKDNALQDNPIMNCSDFDMNDNVTIRCYSFVSGFTYGAAIVGGLITFTTNTIVLLGNVLTWTSDTGEACCKCFKKSVSLVVAFSPWIIAIVMTGLAKGLPFFRQEFHLYETQFVIYLITMIYLGFPPLIVVLSPCCSCRARSSLYDNIN